MKLPYRLILEILGVLLIIFLFWFVSRLQDNYKRFEHNYAIQHQQKDKPKDEYLTKSEYKEYYANQLDSIKKYINDIKGVKQLQSVTNIYNYYIDSSKTSYFATQLNDSIYDISYSDKCWGFTGLFNSRYGEVTLTGKHFINNFQIIDYWKRRNLWNVKLFPRWGKKEFYRKTISNCKNDSIKVEKINIIKQKDFKNFNIN